MVLTYKLSMTETPLLQGSPEQKSSTPSPPTSQKRDKHELIGDHTRFYQLSPELRLVTLKLAVTCRLIDHFGWYQPILVHCSARTESGHVLFSPLTMLFSQAKATELRLLAAGAEGAEHEVERSTLHLHQHLLADDIQCVITVNTPVCAAIASLRYGLLPLSRDYLQLGKVEYSEASQLSFFKPEGRVIFFRNQGLAVLGSSVEEAFYRLYHVLTACSVQTIALTAGPDKILPMRHDLMSLSATDMFTHTQEESYQSYFECIAKLITDIPLSKLTGATATDSQTVNQSRELLTHFNSSPLLHSNNTNPFLNEPNNYSLSRFSDTDENNLWGFTHHLYPSKDIWNFLPRFPISNPVTFDSLSKVRNTKDHFDQRVYDDLV